jgi:exopolyphosphatase/guanosine-5'-triphosphate,3'-diphosphate pyrophosphatase
MLSPRSKRAVDVLSGILRLANGLERGHRQNIQQISAEFKGRAITLRLKTRFEPDLEIWAADLLKSWLETVLDKTILLESL